MTLFICALGGMMAYFGEGGVFSFGVFTLCGILIYAVQWIVFVPSYLLHTEHFFDLTGGATYILAVLLGLTLSPVTPISVCLTACVCIWALRLAGFLFLRVRKVGKDVRFDKLKKSFPRYFLTWNVQALWIYLTAGSVLAAITSQVPSDIGAIEVFGLTIWALGFSIEVVADWQKWRFRSYQDSNDRFIDEGLWSLSRHPNYFGEITLWTGLAIASFNSLMGLQYATLISPLFVAFLLIRVSGIPLLRDRAEAKWGSNSDYQSYVKRTRLLLPLPKR